VSPREEDEGGRVMVMTDDNSSVIIALFNIAICNTLQYHLYRIRLPKDI